MFFDGVDWLKMSQKEIKPEYVPEIEDDLDTKNIDKMFTREAPAETPEVSNALVKKKFDQFTYVESSIINN